ncbi:protein-tyrosine-phosphatase [Companilactobacillus sp. RD055328]|uniref:low molecular weight protein-tyrosine-phosphatase n=1 Tax=Companilactobacillus sp. RD055328 TaxID=2916634 RepID=UPI001FC839DF|nr:low molecular weight protein-tyrosine-phosphatase [Companilactobacillus sp. RD055328]GKQ42782.1 protein-tyrosine-phosphatase [Companilactobacillus sp. RD055328]
MKSILFVCLGNICRSPMAEMMMFNLVKEAKLSDQIKIQSAATSTYEIGNPPHNGTIAKLKEKNVPMIEHYARKITDNDFEEFDYIIGMDNSNIDDLIKLAPNDKAKSKIYMATSVLDEQYEIQDPWYDENFERTYQQLAEVLPKWINKVSE